MQIQFLRKLSLAAAAAALLAPGAALASGDDDKAMSGKPSVSYEEVKQSFDVAVEKLLAYSVEQRDEALNEARKALDTADAKIETMQDQLDRKWASMSDKARANAREAMRDVEDSRQRIERWYGNMEQSSSTAWGDIQKGFSEAFDVLGEAIERASARFDEDQAPEGQGQSKKQGS